MYYKVGSSDYVEITGNVSNDRITITDAKTGELLNAEIVSEITDDGKQDITSYIKNYVVSNYAQTLSLSEICKNVNFSLSNISIIFTKNTGMTFRDYLQKVRIKKACELLEKTDKTIAEIANIVGYSDPAFFYQIFKKEMTVTPREYRQQYR